MSKKSILGSKFRALRKAHGLTGIELSKRMGVSQGTISLLEAGKLKPTVKHANALARALNLEGKELQDLKDVVSAYLTEFDRWQAGEGEEVAQYFEHATNEKKNGFCVVAPREAKATLVEDFQLNTLGGLLQTKEYSVHLFAKLRGRTADMNNPFAAIKLERQKALFDQEKLFRFIIGEAALLNGAIPGAVMQEQIRHLEKVSKLPNVSLSFIPLSTPLGSHSYVSFSMYDRKLTVIEGLAQELSIWTEEENRMYAELFDRLSLDGVPLEELEFVKLPEREQEQEGDIEIERIYH